MTKYGAIIARIQLMSLHEGHLHLANEVNKIHKGNIIFLLGVSNKVNYRNPLPFEIRKEIVLDTYPNAIVLPIHDIGNDDLWSKEVDKTLSEYDVCLYGSRDSFIKYYSGQLETYYIEPIQDVSATELREQLRLNPPKTTDYRSGYIIGCLDTIDKLSLRYNIVYQYQGCEDSILIPITSDTNLVSNETEILLDIEKKLNITHVSDSDIEYMSNYVKDGVIYFSYFVYNIYE